ncbi:nitrous oxide-stimulated promoter family protein [Nautilia sp.]
MTVDKFKKEVETLDKFFQIYCKEKHKNRLKREYYINYKNSEIKIEPELCEECHSLLEYAVQRLKECPHDPKPRCRNCENPCYEKNKYKQMAKMMRFAGMRLGLTKAAQKIKKIFKKS